jgi:hypothetical protein
VHGHDHLSRSRASTPVGTCSGRNRPRPLGLPVARRLGPPPLGPRQRLAAPPQIPGPRPRPAPRHASPRLSRHGLRSRATQRPGNRRCPAPSALTPSGAQSSAIDMGRLRNRTRAALARRSGWNRLQVLRPSLLVTAAEEQGSTRRVRRPDRLHRIRGETRTQDGGVAAGAQVGSADTGPAQSVTRAARACRVPASPGSAPRVAASAGCPDRRVAGLRAPRRRKRGPPRAPSARVAASARAECPDRAACPIAPSAGSRRGPRAARPDRGERPAQKPPPAPPPPPPDPPPLKPPPLPEDDGEFPIVPSADIMPPRSGIAEPENIDAPLPAAAAPAND